LWSGEQKEKTRTINKVEVEVEDRGFSYGSDQKFINICVSAKSFLWHQVRKITAVLVDVGKGTLEITDIAKLFSIKNPDKSPPMAPALGLYLLSVKYPPYNILATSEQACQPKQRKKVSKVQEKLNSATTTTTTSSASSTESTSRKRKRTAPMDNSSTSQTEDTDIELAAKRIKSSEDL